MISDVPDDWNFQTRDYDAMAGYGQSKTANVLFARALDERGAKFGVRAFSVHPGCVVETDLQRCVPRDVALKMGQQMGFYDGDGKLIYDPARQFKTLEQGAATQVWGATAPILNGKGGLFLENCNIAPRNPGKPPSDPMAIDGQGYGGIMDHALNLESANKLWTVSEKATGVKFEI
jgi:hypothetical protein